MTLRVHLGTGGHHEPRERGSESHGNTVGPPLVAGVSRRADHGLPFTWQEFWSVITGLERDYINRAERAGERSDTRDEDWQGS